MTQVDITNTYRILQWIPDPLRDERINVGMIYTSDHGEREVWVLDSDEFALVAIRAPRSSAEAARGYLDELRQAKDQESVQQLLGVFDPHYRIGDLRKLAGKDSSRISAAATFDQLVRPQTPNEDWGGGITSGPKEASLADLYARLRQAELDIRESFDTGLVPHIKKQD